MIDARFAAYCLTAGLGAALLAAPFSASASPSAAAPALEEQRRDFGTAAPLPSSQKQRLNRAKVALAKQPKSVDALIEAGNAAVDAGEFEAAFQYFSRARAIAPESTAIDLGLASAYIRSGRPVSALPLLAVAEAAGNTDRAVLEARALAFDMVGDQRGAQQIYEQLLKVAPGDPKLIRHLALSHAITGNNAQFEAALRPLVEKRDFAAFRTRAFGLAIMGEQNRAAAIVDAVMPRELARKITPYLQYMPSLTPAQQAAAANFGIFPRPEDIGKDTPAIAAYAARGAVAARLIAPAEPTADARLEPAGNPLGSLESEAAGLAGIRIVEVNAPAQSPTKAQPPAQSASDQQPAKAAQLEPAQSASVADAFADLVLDAPDKDASGLKEASGAVDLTAITIPLEPKPEPAEPAQPAELDHPRRIWVQVATGRDVKALGFDWRRLSRKSGDLLDAFEPHWASWGQTNRLLAGPIETRAKARDLVNALNERGVNTFTFISPEGKEIHTVK